MLYNRYLYIFLSLLTQGLFAQFEPDSKNDTLAEKSKFRIALAYASDYYFMGRVDSVRAPYLTPSLAYYHKSGLFIKTSLSYLTASNEGRIDLFRLSGGYDISVKKFGAGISLSEYFFSESSFVVQSEMSTYLYGYSEYEFKFIKLYLDGSLGFSSTTDVFLGLEINHTFRTLKNKLRIIPAFYLNAGTQKYYSDYITNRSSKSIKNANGTVKGQQTANSTVYTTTETQSFEMLDYEADIQFIYVFNKFRVFMSPTWLFPVNPATIVTASGTSAEELKNGFYFSMGIRFTL
jgi:hypothetical protein